MYFPQIVLCVNPTHQMHRSYPAQENRDSLNGGKSSKWLSWPRSWLQSHSLHKISLNNDNCHTDCLVHFCMCAKSFQSCPTLHTPMDYSPPGSSVHGLLQARILEWVAMLPSRGSTQPRDQTCIFYVSWIGRCIPGSSCGKESACNAGDLSLILRSGGSAGEGIGYPPQCSWASLVSQLVKNLPAMRETWVWSLGWEDPLEKGTATHSSILAWRIPWTV